MNIIQIANAVLTAVSIVQEFRALHPEMKVKVQYGSSGSTTVPAETDINGLIDKASRHNLRMDDVRRFHPRRTADDNCKINDFRIHRLGE